MSTATATATATTTTERSLESPTDAVILDQLTNMVQQFRCNPHMELEVRLGVCSAQQDFDPNVTFEYSERLYESMTDKLSVSIWDAPPVERNYIYRYFGQQGKHQEVIRGTYGYDLVAPLFHRIRKVQILDMKCPGRFYDLRVSLKEEVPLENQDILSEADWVRLNSRLSFRHRGQWQYDFTKVGEGKTAFDACKHSVLNVELELLRDASYLHRHSNRDIGIDLMGRARDLLGRFTFEGIEEPPMRLEFIGMKDYF